MQAPVCWFDHEKLEVYREAIAFVAWIASVLENTVRTGDVRDQLDRALRIDALSPGWRWSFEALLKSQTTDAGSGNAGLAPAAAT